MATTRCWILICGLTAISNALTVDQFQNISPGIWDAWNNTDPSNVNQGRFGMVAANGNLWLISRRLYRTGFDHPWDPASRGGIVSRLDTTTNVWTHKAYPRLDEDKYGDQLFSLSGRLFMLTYETTGNKIGYHKLFVWSGGTFEWSEVSVEIDPSASTYVALSIAMLSVDVPEQSGNVAYCVASSHKNAQRGSEMAFAKLDVEFLESIPTKATLKPVARDNANEPSAVFFTATKGDLLYAFFQDFLSEGYVPMPHIAYTVDLRNGQVSNVSLAGPMPPMGFDGERMFQVDNEILLFGGAQAYGLGEVRWVSDIWSLNLDTLEWKVINMTMPEGAGGTTAYDQLGKLYLADLHEGVRVAQVNAGSSATDHTTAGLKRSAVGILRALTVPPVGSIRYVKRKNPAVGIS